MLSPMGIDERIRLALGDRHDIRLAYLPTPALLDRLTEDLRAATERRVDLVVLNAAPPLLAREHEAKPTT